ncbi:alanine--tRNA ligase [Candidatus Gracilibacteria bacterium]|nr:alanine--tRNA ligase [Candidatus Gracilibacteria bacterium]
MQYTSFQLRQKYLDFFRSKNHAIIPSAPLVPENDASVLFNTAGMQPLVPYLLGEKHPMGNRLADVQKCVRTGDIDDVGDDTHCTFFEMLGNWSLGDYFKQGSIEMSWEFLTSLDWLGLDPKMISVTVFEGDDNAPRDDESAKIWMDLGMPAERIAYLAAEDNWWAAGPTGPCGPDTEIFYWVGEGEPQGNKGTHSKEWMEIWNNVFMQFNKKSDGTLESLPAQNVDTGMGLERTLAVINGKKTVYHTDLFENTIEHIKRIVGESNFNERGARIIADHLRTAVHMISDGVKPSNTDRGYVLRRLIRRAIREAHKMGHEDACLAQVARDFIHIYQDVYESVKNNETVIIDEISNEEAKFQKTITAGFKELEKLFNKFIINRTEVKNSGEHSPMHEHSDISGRELYHIFETYGLPLEMSLEELCIILKERDIPIEEDRIKEEFSESEKAHQDLSRTASAGMFKGGLADHSDVTISLHTACHLMLAGLRKVLGEHVMQAGSNITPERLRFDFTHPEKMTPEQIVAVEEYVNGALKSHLTVTMTEEPKDNARSRGVLGAFWEKYPETVKVYKMVGDDGVTYSEELCGGPHVEESSKMGTFKIQKEEASSAGVRRIKAVLN